MNINQLTKMSAMPSDEVYSNLMRICDNAEKEIKRYFTARELWQEAEPYYKGLNKRNGMDHVLQLYKMAAHAVHVLASDLIVVNALGRSFTPEQQAALKTRHKKYHNWKKNVFSAYGGNIGITETGIVFQKSA